MESKTNGTQKNKEETIKTLTSNGLPTYKEMVTKPCNQITIELHKLTLANDSQELKHNDLSIVHIKSNDDKNKTHELSKDNFSIEEVKDMSETSHKVTTKLSHGDGNTQSTDVLQFTIKGNTCDIQFSAETTNTTQSVMVTPADTSNISYTCSSEVQTVENPLYIRVTHQEINNDKKAQQTNTAPAVPDEANLLVVSDAIEPESDEYVEMRSLVTDAVVPQGKLGALNTVVTTKSQKLHATIGKDPNFGSAQVDPLPMHYNYDHESDTRVNSKLQHSASWSTVNNAQVTVHKETHIQGTAVEFSTDETETYREKSTDSRYDKVPQVPPVDFNSNSSQEKNDNNIDASSCGNINSTHVKMHRNPAYVVTVNYTAHNRGHTYDCIPLVHTLPRAVNTAPSHSTNSYTKACTQDHM
ncbi:uncharacterized protein [Dysidea avara]|uniref:uncharacterized protein n=1 Tax=Dysidea avara TaxID=196820 RepID=UPI00332C5C4D